MSSSPLSDTETEEIMKIKHRLDSDEKVEIVAKQSRIHPGGSATSPDIIFITNKRIIIKNPSLLGARHTENYESTYIMIRFASIEYPWKTEYSHLKLIFMPLGYAGEIEAIPKDKARGKNSVACQGKDGTKNHECQTRDASTNRRRENINCRCNYQSWLNQGNKESMSEFRISQIETKTIVSAGYV